MRRTTEADIDICNKILLNTKELQALLSCGRHSAVILGANAEARVDIGKRVLWNREKIEKYVEQISL